MNTEDSRAQVSGGSPQDSGWLTLLACPTCGGTLAQARDGLCCLAGGETFARHPTGLFDLRPAAGRPAAEAFSVSYAAARREEGWRPLTAGAACALPFGRPAGFTRLYWAVRRESWRALAATLASRPPPLLMADLGAGFPWLSHRLAMLGHRVVALDLSADTDFGLGAARLFPTAWTPPAALSCPVSGERGDTFSLASSGVNAGGVAEASSLLPGQFLPILGDLTRPPLAAGSYDVIICNASLHYAADLPAAVGRIAQAMRPGALLIVMDSPVADRPRVGSRPGSRVLGRAELEEALRAAGCRVAWLPVHRGWLWQWHRLKVGLLRRPNFEFPLVIARNAGPAA